ncbi:hypothetical protein BpHYR1_027917 [Brachionus plicatilis]|uniref:Uncharacterized protein n=1 Tax=Brachionus plicatilis TaxID=10195 RepID=A0A3M7T9K7_BRAPC|nr:hypothetical protein BpHYR1_027917 [Brachionus plicatilis]
MDGWMGDVLRRVAEYFRFEFLAFVLNSQNRWLEIRDCAGPFGNVQARSLANGLKGKEKISLSANALAQALSACIFKTARITLSKIIK